MAAAQKLLDQLKDSQHPERLNALLTEIVASLARQESKTQVQQVAFSAALVKGTVTLGPYDEDRPLIFKNVFTNIGDGYNAATGVFTAPVKGAYHFQWYIGAYGSDNATAAALVHKGARTFGAYELQGTGFGSSSQGITLHLEAGESTFLRLCQGGKVFDNGNNHTTFSGHLLFLM